MNRFFTLLFVALIAVEITLGFDCGKYCNYATENHTAEEDKLLNEIDTAEVTSHFSSFFHNLPHYDNEGKNIGNSWNPTDVDYYIAIGYTGSPLGAAFFLSGLVATIAVIARCCTIYCKKHTTKYSKTAICCTKFCSFIICLILCAPIVLALVANLTVHDGVLDSVNQYTDQQERIYSTLNSVELVLNSMNNSQATEISLEFSSYTNTSNQWTLAQYYIDHYALYAEYYRNIAVCCLAGICLLLVIVFSISCCCSSKCCTVCLSSTILLFAPLLFLFSAAHVPAAVFVADMCPQVDAYIANQTKTNNDYQYFQYYTACNDTNMNPLFEVNETVSEYLVIAQIALQNAIHNGDPISTIDRLRAIVDDLKSLEGYIVELSDCNTTSNSWNQIKSNICTEFLDGIGYMIIFNIISVFFFWILVGVGYRLVVMLRSPMTKDHDGAEYHQLDDSPHGRHSHRRNSYNTFQNRPKVHDEEIGIVINSYEVPVVFDHLNQQPTAPPPYNNQQVFIPPSQNVNRNPFDERVFESKDNDSFSYPILYPNVVANPTAPSE